MFKVFNDYVADSVPDDSLEADEPAAVLEGQDSHPTGIVLHRVGYYTIPSLDELVCHMHDDGSCVVDNFTVGREGYGNVFFPDSFDVADLNLDEIGEYGKHRFIIIFHQYHSSLLVCCLL
jgi:nuclear pore complex protein Nup98-Nup96